MQIMSDIFVVLPSLKRCTERVKAAQIIDDDIYHVISAEMIEAIRSHAGLRPTAPCGRYPVGQQEVREHEAPGGSL